MNKTKWRPIGYENPRSNPPYFVSMSQVYEEGYDGATGDIAKWGEEECKEHDHEHSNHPTPYYVERRECSKCWQTLKGE